MLEQRIRNQVLRESVVSFLYNKKKELRKKKVLNDGNEISVPGTKKNIMINAQTFNPA